MKLRILFLGVLVLVAGLNSLAQDQKKMNAFIDQLMSKMTVEEKIGQMNLLPSTSATTGELKAESELRYEDNRRYFNERIGRGSQEVAETEEKL